MTRRVSSSASMKKAVLLILAFILVFFLYLIIPRLGRLMKETTSQPNYSRGEYGTEVQDSIRGEWAGFWVYEDTSADKGSEGTESVLSEVDRIEFKDNGIIWRVRDLEIYLEDYDTLNIRHIYQGYCRPFKKMNDKINCETRLVKQVVIKNRDTCYATQEDVVWLADMREEEFFLNGKQYSDYGEDNLAEFFPEGNIDLVDDISIDKCYDGLGLEYILSRKLNSYFRSNVLIADGIKESIRRYFFPLLLREKFYHFDWAGRDSCVIELNFEVDDKGDIRNCLIDVNIDNFSNWKENSICGIIERIGFDEDAAGKGKKFDMEFVLKPR